MKKMIALQLVIIRVIHTIIWVLMTGAVFYVFFSGITGKINSLSWLGVGLISLEALALILGKGDCPLHIYALRLTGLTEINDTYLPEKIFFKGYKIILTIIFLIGLLLMIYQKF